MKMHIKFPLFSVLLFIVFIQSISAQQTEATQPTAAHHHNSAHEEFECDMHKYSDELNAMEKASRIKLVERGILPPKHEVERNQMVTLFQWPLRQAAGFNQFSYYAVANFVDQTSGSGLGDYACNARTYNDHKGTDIINWPFGWKMMTDEHVEVIAAAPGVIVKKLDNRSNWSCTLGGIWNAVRIEHADGSRAWYGHLKEGSLTSKPEGATVSTGEYLGQVASSGSSTYPHLHFEIVDASGTIIDPYQGNCNSTTNTSWWANQKPYWEPTLNHIQTHSASAATSTTCHNMESPNFENNFQPGDLIYYASYYHDEQNGHSTAYTVKNPNGTTILAWTHTANASRTWSSYQWSAALPSNAVEGTYSYNVSYQGNIFTHYFFVGCPSNVTISNQTVTSASEYQASNSISTSGTVQVNSGASLSQFRAGNRVTFNPGFIATEGSQFVGQLGGCQ